MYQLNRSCAKERIHCCQLLLAANPLILSREIACVLLHKHLLEWEREASGETESVKNFSMSQSVKVCIGFDTRVVLCSIFVFTESRTIMLQYAIQLICCVHTLATILIWVRARARAQEVILRYTCRSSELVYLNSTNYSYTNLSTDQTDSLHWSDGTWFASSWYVRCI